MVSTRLVLLAVAIELAALVAGLAVLVGHGAWFATRKRRLASRLGAARLGLATRLAETPGDELPVTLLDGLPTAQRLSLLGDAAPSIAGAQRVQLRELGRRAGMLDRASRLCHSRRWRRRLRGARIYTLLGGGEEDVPTLFADRQPAVRAEAAAWGAAHPAPEIVARLLELLGDTATRCRFTVKDSLLRVGPAAVEPLAEFLETASGAPAAAGLEVAAPLNDPRLLDAAFRLVRDEDPATRRLATDALGALGGERAATTLTVALHDSAAEVRAAAAAALGRGHHWAAGAELAAALRDGSWEVRHAAGMSLRRLGAPGELLLRRALEDEDGFARDMARLMRELPPSSS